MTWIDSLDIDTNSSINAGSLQTIRLLPGEGVDTWGIRMR